MTKRKTWKKIHFLLTVLLLVLVFCSIDLGRNYSAALLPSINDGITCRSIIFYMIHGDRNWSLESFWRAYDTCMALTAFVTLLNAGVILYENVFLKEKWREQEELSC